MSALWHPLGVGGNTLVTVTAEAAVRMWEFDIKNLHTFSTPSLAFDMKKLIDATSSQDDVQPLGYGKSHGYSSDTLDMQVASACFGGSGLEDENGWASMTLWVAMRNGDVYTLCPLLPMRVQPPSSTIPSLSTSVVSKVASLQGEEPEDEEDRQALEEERRQAGDQKQWLTAIDNEEPTFAPKSSEFAPNIRTYSRPSTPGPVPRLQGPLELPLEAMMSMDEELELTDIYAIAAKLDMSDLIGDEEELLDDVPEEGVSANIICLLTSQGKIHVCLDASGIEAQWLPSSKDVSTSFSNTPGELLLVESIETQSEQDASKSTNWPTITQDVQSRYSFFVTNSTNISFLSLSSWAERLESEFQTETDDTQGSLFRLEALSKSSCSFSEPIHLTDVSGMSDLELMDDLSAPVVFEDSDLGYCLFTTSSDRPFALTFDFPISKFPSASPEPLQLTYETESPLNHPLPPRSSYQPPAIFYNQPFNKDTFLNKHVPPRQRTAINSEIRLSQATMDLMTTAHRTLSAETQQLQKAVGELFRRCGRLQDELKDQIRKVQDHTERIRNVTDDSSSEPADADESGEKSNKRSKQEQIQERIQAARDRHEDLMARFEAARKKLANDGGRELSAKEREWVAEVASIGNMIGVTTEGESEAAVGEEDAGEEQTHAPRRRGRSGPPKSSLRYKAVRDAVDRLTTEAREQGEQKKSASRSGERVGGVRVPVQVQKTAVARAKGMLDREYVHCLFLTLSAYSSQQLFLSSLEVSSLTHCAIDLL